ncbi:MAG: hypothetical protein K2F89_03160, partial [Treponemataceae bacterium]|nr:hypothetical protein [Treponemataceae bacterium]
STSSSGMKSSCAETPSAAEIFSSVESLTQLLPHSIFAMYVLEMSASSESCFFLNPSKRYNV